MALCCTSLFPMNEETDAELRVPSADPRYDWNPVGPALSLRNGKCLRPSGLEKRCPGLLRLGKRCPGPPRLVKRCPGPPRLEKRCPGPPRAGKRCLWAGEGGVHQGQKSYMKITRSSLSPCRLVWTFNRTWTELMRIPVNIQYYSRDFL
jgi:hypothetical protein